MLNFEVKDMICGHCVAAITRAVHAVSSGAVVDIDLASHRVRVNGSTDEAAVAAAIRESGYSPVIYYCFCFVLC